MTMTLIIILGFAAIALLVVTAVAIVMIDPFDPLEHEKDLDLDYHAEPAREDGQ